MADSKVSELTSATSLGGADVFYVVQSDTSKKITAAKIFENAANVTLKGNINIDPSVQTLGAAGVIDLTKPVTHLIASASNGTLTLPVGTPGQVKVLVMTSSAGGTYNVYGNMAASANVSFNNNGDTATLLFTNNKWYMIGGTANVTY